jgi:hypothetical protein
LKDQITHCIIKSTIMKTAILLFALDFVTEVQAIHLRIGDGGADPTSNIANLKKRPDSQARAREILESKDCASFVEKISAGVEKLLAYNDDAIIGFACNPIERDLIKENERGIVDHNKKEASAASGGNTNKCKEAMDAIIGTQDYEEKVNQAFEDNSFCAAEVSKEVVALRKELMNHEGDALSLGFVWFLPFLAAYAYALLVAAMVVRAHNPSQEEDQTV